MKQTLFAALLITLASCKTVHKLTQRQATKKDSSAVENVVTKVAEKIDSSKDVKTTEVAFITTEDTSSKTTVIETYSPEGKIVTRKIIKQKTGKKSTGSAVTAVREITAHNSDSVASHVENKITHVDTAIKTKDAKIDRKKFLPGWWLIPIILVVLFVVYRFVKSKFPSKFYPF